MKSLITWFIRNPVAANLMMLVMVFVGIFGYTQLDREMIPTITINGMSVTTTWPGASPQDIEEQLVSRIEEAIDGLDGIDYIESSAQEGLAQVNIRTKVNVDYEKMLDQVKSQVDAIQNLPPDAYRPQVIRWDERADIMFLALHGDVERLELQRLGNEIRQKLTKLDGLQLTKHISKVNEQVTIEVSEQALQQYNLTFSQVSAAISASSVNLSAGTVETSGGNLQLRTRSLANTEEEFGNIIIRQTSDGGVVRLKQIANINDGFESIKFVSTFKGETAAIFQVSSPDNMNITIAGKEIRQFEKDIQDSLPPGVKFSIWFDGSTMFDSRMELISGNALSGMILVLIILVLFLRPVVALWVTIGIAAAFMGALAIAPMIGITLNMISMFAFLLVIGIVVDDAIVVGESIYFHVENGIEGQAAAIGGANMVAKPVFFAVITTILMFVPFYMMTGPIQAITAQISLVVIAVLTFSLIEAFFILPAHLRHLKEDHKEPGPLMRFQHRMADSLTHFAATTFRPVVAWLIKFRYITLATFVGLFIMAIGLLASGIIPSAFIPKVEGDMITFNARFPEGTPFERRDQVREQVDAGVLAFNEGAREEFGVDFDLITEPGSFTGRNSVQSFFGLAPAKQRDHISTKQIAEKLEEYVGPIPDAFRVQYTATEDDGTGGSDGLRFGVASNNLDDISRAVKDLKANMETYGSVLATYDTLESTAQEVRFTLKPGAQTLGITLAEVTQQVREAFYGREVQRLPRNGEDVRVLVRYPETARESIDSLNNLKIRTQSGAEIPLYTVADISFAEGVNKINRRDRKRIEYTGARVKGGQAEAGNIRKEMNQLFFPEWKKRHPNVDLVIVGGDEVTENFVKEMKISGVVIMFIMYGLLAIAFKSYAQPLLIMVAIPFALVGMVVGNIITGVPFGIMSVFGFFAASGVAVNDNLVLIDYVNRLRAKGIGAYQAMLDACVARFRPILLTSVTTFVGITPILFETSTQAEFLKPMVVALAYGVLFDFFLTLMLVPALYGIGVDIRRFFLSRWTGVKQPPLGSSYDPDIAVALEDFEAQELQDLEDAAPAE